MNTKYRAAKFGNYHQSDRGLDSPSRPNNYGVMRIAGVKSPSSVNHCYQKWKEIRIFAELQLIIVKRNRVIIKYIRGIGNPNITFHNFVY